MKRFVGLTVCVLGLAALASSLVAQDEPSRLVFNGGNKEGEVWANVALTGQRLDQEYIPMVVMVVNRGRDTVSIDRDAIRLVGKDGNRYPMPTLKELRKGYGKFSLDVRAVSGAGIPYEVWQRDRRLVESNFFPHISSSRRAIVIDEVNLPPGYAMIDLLYFARPKGLIPGEPFLIEVHPFGWEAPIHLGIMLN